MDIIKSASNIIKLIYAKRRGENVDADLVQKVCVYFDSIKGNELSSSDLHFLRYIANEAGVPQYYVMLSKFQHDLEQSEVDLHIKDLPVLVGEASLCVADDVQLHKYQMNVLNRFENGKSNRYFLSASTSFGKTFLIYEILRKMQYDNVCFIFPTIALLSENLLKIYNSTSYQWVKQGYKVHTLSDTELQEHHNLFIYTPERFLSFMDKHQELKFDFFFVDEVYKIDNEYLVDDEQRENERDVAYRIATQIGMECSRDCLLTGPYIKIDENNSESSIERFLHWGGMSFVDYGTLEIVGKQEVELKSSKKIKLPDTQTIINFTSVSKKERFKELVCSLVNNNENVIVYTATKAQVENYARELLADDLLPDVESENMGMFLQHLENLFKNKKGAQWIVTMALKKGIGVHHGLVPKYIQNEIIDLFNNGVLKVLISTTTITEGVNTTAKNMVVLSHKKGRKELKPFDAKNIEGRAGRFIHHYMGRVFVFDKEFLTIKNEATDELGHKFFDRNTPKTSVDIPFIDNCYLTEREISEKKWIADMANSGELPSQILDVYKTIAPKDKYYLFQSVKRMTEQEKEEMRSFISSYNGSKYIKKSGLEVIFGKIKSILPQQGELLKLIEIQRDRYCLMTNLVSVFLKQGFVGSVNYYINSMGVDEAVRYAAKFVFNTLRYQVVKYLGLFNVCYKYALAQERNVETREIVGIDSLLMRMEYNADTPYGRKASDAGAPFAVIDYFDKLYSHQNDAGYELLDEYEKQNVRRIRNIVLS